MILCFETVCYQAILLGPFMITFMVLGQLYQYQLINPQRAGTELTLFNLVNIMAADALAPGHQQPWYWLRRKDRFLSYVRKDFNYLCRTNVEKWHKM